MKGKSLQAVPVGKGGMLAVLGLEINQVKNLIKDPKFKICEIANDNANGQENS